MELKIFVVFQTVENTDEQKAQADALSVIFTLAKENVTYAKEMDGLLANKMILKVLLTPNCEPGYHFVKVCISADIGLGVRVGPYLYCISTPVVSFSCLLFSPSRPT
jgi:hypothetical protein